MALLRCRAIKKNFGEHAVLQGAAFDLAGDEKVGLVGHNGCGKTTLANIIFGSIEPDGGAVEYGGENLRIGYLLQNGGYKVHVRGVAVETGFAAEADQSTHERAYGENHIFRKTASGIGLDRVWEWSGERYANLSGGERTKLALAGVWSSKPDLLILDEPTNHLDFAGIDWLVGEVARFGGAVIIISHDRYFLDQSVNRISELDDGRISEYSGNYTRYKEEKLRRYESQLRQHLNDVKQQEKLAAEIANLKNWSEKAHRTSRDAARQSGNGKKEYFRVKAKKMDRQVKSRIKRLENMQRDGVGKPKEEAGVFFEFESPDKRGMRLIAGTAVSKSFGELRLLSDCTFFVKRGECIGLVGPNGCGKTTLIRMIIGEQQPDQGEIWISPSARAGYLSQNGSETDLTKRVIDIVGDLPVALRTKARTVLANMGFKEDVIEKQLSQFSMGEVTRIRLAELIFKGCNLLILDEPTNHLDLASREQLEATLVEYGGAVLLVSHDRYMLEKLCDRYLVFTGVEAETGTTEKTQGSGDGVSRGNGAGGGLSGGAGGGLIRVDGSLQEWLAAQAAAGAAIRRNQGPSQAQIQAQANGGSDDDRGQGERGSFGDGGEGADGAPDAAGPEQLMAIENRIAYLLGQLSRYKPTDSEYHVIDRELNELMAAKKRHV
ncbi:MAG TPA: ABC transporter ATP-binding protein [Firmicutes bacterium]|nr:ABC transporter ATP-binding protein [Bacillota bacterium]HBG44456.1 ABC transporter ATP-binding protein [Bacillota bacterium]HBL68316.1 ABC transporter ATP-binding protein [Bacillota bacterium]HCF91441.1 ABC transporter ATP-binding protein [Bacillota bacterium]HCX69661.1 ABC transporter ATP-binding protein [Bacillota bacterium]